MLPTEVVNQSINPYAVAGAIAAISGITLGWLGYRKSSSTDRDTKLNVAISQVVVGLNTLIDQLQEDNVEYRRMSTKLRNSNEDLAEDNVKLHVIIRTLEYRIEACDARVETLREIEAGLRERLPPPDPPAGK